MSRIPSTELDLRKKEIVEADIAYNKWLKVESLNRLVLALEAVNDGAENDLFRSKEFLLLLRSQKVLLQKLELVIDDEDEPRLLRKGEKLIEEYEEGKYYWEMGKLENYVKSLEIDCSLNHNDEDYENMIESKTIKAETGTPRHNYMQLLIFLGLANKMDIKKESNQVIFKLNDTCIQVYTNLKTEKSFDRTEQDTPPIHKHILNKDDYIVIVSILLLLGSFIYISVMEGIAAAIIALPLFLLGLAGVIIKATTAKQLFINVKEGIVKFRK